MEQIIHIAGVNRADSDEAVEQGNVALAETLAAAVRANGAPVDLVYANSVQADLDNAYGRGKARAAEILEAVVTEVGGSFADLLLPNLFGEHGRPGYNSFVATFAHEVAAGRTPTVTGDREIPLLHAQDAAAALIGALGTNVRAVVDAETIAISEVLQFFTEAHELYATRGEVPDISTPMRRNLFNTYRAAAFPDMWPISPQVHADNRGDLFETVRAHGGTGMAFMSTTLPGQKRGEHYHLHKVERFFVVKGEAEIELRRLLHDDVVTFRLSGDKPVVRRHAHDVGAQHPQRGRHRAGHHVLGGPVARHGQPGPVPRDDRPGGIRMKVMTVVGTRPEIIRLARVIDRLDKTEGIEHVLVHTGQNYDYSLNQVFFDDLGLRAPDHYMGVDTSSLGAVLGGVLDGHREGAA